MKKREKTINLVGEAETLETQNIDLKSQVRSLEMERRSLTEMLQLHTASCMRDEVFGMPVLNISIVKYLHGIGLGTSQSNQNISNSYSINKGARTKNSANKITSNKIQKIPPVNTLRFNNNNNTSRRSQLKSNLLSTTCNSNIMNSANLVTTSTICVPMTIADTSSPIQDSKPLPSIDMGFCEGRSLTPTGNYNCKQLISNSNECYALSSPDSGFIKSPVDMGNYTLPSIIKSDYIPNCEAGSVEMESTQLFNHQLDTSNNNNVDGIEFILKSELVDANDSPYTTVQSADRFLFDGVAETFDADIDSTNNAIQNHPIHMHLDGLKEHLLLQSMNHNNNNSSHINNNHHHDMNSINSSNTNHHMPQQNMDAINNSAVITSVLPHSSNSIIEFNTNSCQQFINENSLLKGDFLSQNCEFISLANDSCDSQFTTDLDSGVTTYTNMANGNGCLA